MRVAIFGSYDWNDYNSFIREMTLFIQDAHDLGHRQILFVHGGKAGAENMITEYIGKTQKFLRQKDFKLKEELFKKRNNFLEVDIIESGIDYAIIFSTKDKKTYKSKQILEAYGMPFKIVENT